VILPCIAHLAARNILFVITHFKLLKLAFFNLLALDVRLSNGLS
jgi:hypothetical protein